MRLADLEPQFIRATENGTRDVATFAEAQGMLFLCPCRDGHSCLVWFRDRGVPDEETPGPGRWTVGGTGLANLTLSPSIQVRCWHGFVTNGLVTTC